ncbi:hypothetical protein HPB47_025295, partial [Ixodes persulcatus]
RPNTLVPSNGMSARACCVPRATASFLVGFENHVSGRRRCKSCPLTTGSPRNALCYQILALQICDRALYGSVIELPGFTPYESAEMMEDPVRDLYPFSDDGPATRAFLSRVFEILWQYVDQQQDRSSKILDFHMPDKLMQMLDLDLPEDPLDLGQLFKDCSDALKFQVRTGHPHFFNQLSSGLDIVSLAGEWLSAAANTNMFTYEIAPVFILMENVVMKKMRDLIGYTNGDSILAPGGSVSNLYAVMAARHKKFPDYKTMGLKALPQLVMYTSED